MSGRSHLTARFGAIATLLAAGIALTTARGPDHSVVHHRAAAAVSSTATTTVALEPFDSGRVVVFGDSLMHESRAYLARHLERFGSVEFHTAPMTAPCDFVDAIGAALVTPPRLAVLEFSGNAITSCMRNADGSLPAGAELATRYEQDTTLITQRLVDAGVRVLWVDAPRGRPSSLTPLPTRTDQFSGEELFTNPIYRDLVARFRGRGANVGLVRASRALLTDTGAWTPTLPCLAMERTSGACGSAMPDRVVAVRAPDGAHFCPTGRTNAEGLCAVWSGGAWRYARAVAAAIAAVMADP